MSLFSPVVRLLAALVLAFALPAAPALANDDGTLTYRVKKGDTLYGLAAQYMRSQADARRVQRLNRVRNPRRLPVNKRLRLPRELLRYDPVILQVGTFSGPVRINGQVPAVNQRVFERDVITTQGNGFISFKSNIGAKFTMPSNSTMRLDRARRYLLNGILDIDFTVLKGRGSAGSPRLKDQDRLQMRTPVATTAARGTEFRVAHLEGEERSLTEVIEGSVNVAAGEAEGVTEAGFGVASTQAGIGEAEALLAAVEFIEPGKIQTDEKLTFTLVPQARAQAYRVQVARDAGFLEVVSEVVTTGTQVTFDSLDDARYNIRARAVSASGIEGNSKAESFRRKRLGVSGSAGKSDLLDGFLFKWQAVGEGARTFAFQLWPEGNRDALIVDETGLIQQSLVLTDLPPGDYQWRIAVIQADPEEGLLKVWGDAQNLGVSE
jgi:hypothetical protein